VPVKLAEPAGLERHVDACKLIGDGKPGTLASLAEPPSKVSAFTPPRGVAEGWKRGPAKRRRCGSVTRFGGLAAQSLSAPVGITKEDLMETPD
jgi:hypothetical protein